MALLPINALYASGEVLYAVLVSPTGQFYNTVTPGFENYVAGHWAQYAVALTEFAGSGIYQGTYPVASPAVLTTDIIFQQAGGTPTLGDPPASNIYSSQGTNLAALATLVASANNLALTSGAMVQGAATATVLTSTAFTTTLTSTTNAAYQGRLCVFTDGVLSGQIGNIIAYNGEDFMITVAGPFTSAPGAGDTFIIV